MNKKIIISMLFLFFLMAGCNSENTKKTNVNKNPTDYYMIESGNKTYYDNDKFMENVYDFYTVLDNTIASFNEIRNGKRDLSFTNQIESEELKKDEEYEVFKRLIPGESEVKITRADILSYEVTALYYDKDQNTVKAFITIETNEQGKERLTKVYNKQTYIYRIENSKLLLVNYDPEQHLR